MYIYSDMLHIIQERELSGLMSQTIVFNDMPVGYVENGTYYTKRDPFKKFGPLTLGFSEKLLNMLKDSFSVKTIVNRRDGELSLRANIEDFLGSEFIHDNGDGDLQRFVPIEEMEKFDESVPKRPVNFIEYEEMLHFLETLKEKYRTNVFSQIIFYGEVGKRKRDWKRGAIVKCLKYLHKNGKVRVGDNFEIILVV